MQSQNSSSGGEKAEIQKKRHELGGSEGCRVQSVINRPQHAGINQAYREPEENSYDLTNKEVRGLPRRSGQTELGHPRPDSLYRPGGPLQQWCSVHGEWCLKSARLDSCFAPAK